MRWRFQCICSSAKPALIYDSEKRVKLQECPEYNEGDQCTSCFCTDPENKCFFDKVVTNFIERIVPK